MTESYPKSPIDISTLETEKLLHGESIQIHASQVLHDLEATRSQGFNGVTVTEIILPSPVSLGSDIDKKIALIDFGEDAETSGKAVLYYPETQKELASLGVTNTRYGLVTLNYHPSDRLAGIVPLRPGRSIIIGRDKENRNNYLLGLLEGENQELSRSHIKLSLDEQGLITIEDLSTNGTKIILPPLL
ncbi:MAG: FHA domain-containing protein [Candidatus Saccharimonadales bacterium]|jgi:hypothetical protein